MGHPFARAILAVVALAALLTVTGSPAFGNALWLFGLVAAGGLLLWASNRCQHRGPLGLLPASRRPDGTREPSRWFCDACGKVWPAGINHDDARSPIVKYTGYDQTKAPLAARRAAQLEKRRHDLAVRRAGLMVTRVQECSAQMLADPTVVSIDRGRSHATTGTRRRAAR